MNIILIVDDEEEIRNMIIAYLKREGLNGIGASNGVDALQILKRQEVNLVILDIMMEGFDGFEVLKQIRQNHPKTPVIFLSARQEECDKVLGLGLGADDYIVKPFSPGELMARVKVQLRRNYKQSDNSRPILQFQNISMDLRSYKVKVGENEVPLVGKELLLMKFFLENQGQVFTKTQIYHQIWEDSFEDDNTVMVYISHLRDKIEENPKEPKYIKTIRGIGYRLGG